MSVVPARPQTRVPSVSVIAAATTIDWAAARQAVRVAGPRLTALLRSVQKPDAPALGTWTVSQLAVHVSHAADTIPAMAQGGGNLIENIWGLSTLSSVMVEGEGRRNPAEIADRIDASVARFLVAMDAAGEDRSCTWMVQGIEMPLSTLTCHLLNELTIHGRDIAEAEGVAWPIERSHAVLIVEGFIYPVLNALGRDMVNQDTAAKVRARLHVRLRGGGQAWLRFHDGDFAVEPSPEGRVDCHLSVDPEAFLLVSWGRISQWPAIGRAQLLAWGRKPWLGLKLRSWLRNP